MEYELKANNCDEIGICNVMHISTRYVHFVMKYSENYVYDIFDDSGGQKLLVILVTVLFYHFNLIICTIQTLFLRVSDD